MENEHLRAVGIPDGVTELFDLTDPDHALRWARVLTEDQHHYWCPITGQDDDLLKEMRHLLAWSEVEGWGSDARLARIAAVAQRMLADLIQRDAINRLL